MDSSAIIVAGGSGTRMGAPVPKQFLLLAGKPLLFHTLAAFRRARPEMHIVLVLPPEQLDAWTALCRQYGLHMDHSVVPGGKERFHSVRAGLGQVAHDGLVAVHDGARPLVSGPLITSCLSAAEAHGTAIPVVPVGSSVRIVDGTVSKALDRGPLRIVQTPQCFRVPLLRKAFELPYEPAFTDEATLVERTGAALHLVPGEERNLKVTTPTDLRVAEALFVPA